MTTTDVKFHEKLKEHYKNKTLPEGVESFVLDGILDIDKYNESKYRILWILKEAWGTGLYHNEENCPFEYPHYIKNDFRFGGKFPSSGPMWAKIIYVNYGILNDFKKWGDMPDYWDSEDVYYSLKNCALINLKKIPGGTVSNSEEIYEYYKADKEIILEQIEIIDPQIVICGGTYNFITKDDQFSSLKNNDNIYQKNDKKILFIHAKHPSCRVGHEKYCDDIIQLCKTHFEKIQ